MEYSINFVRHFWDKVVVQDGCWAWVGSKAGGYGKMSHNRTTAYAHRISYELCMGDIPEGMVVDHKCFTRECVNPAHLRITTYKQNTEHRQGPGRSNTSGWLGVSWRKDVRRWKGTVKHDGKAHHVGYFDDPEDAYSAVQAKRNELFTHNDLDRKAA